MVINSPIKKSVDCKSMFAYCMHIYVHIYSASSHQVPRAALTIGLGGAEAPGPEQGGGPWLAVE